MVRLKESAKIKESVREIFFNLNFYPYIYEDKKIYLSLAHFKRLIGIPYLLINFKT